MSSSYTDPVNIGTEDEATVAEWAQVIRDKVEEMRDRGEIPLSIVPSDEAVDSDEDDNALPRIDVESPEVGRMRQEQKRATERGRRSEIVLAPAVVDDPPRRRPDISRARKVLGWEPKYSLETGIEETIK